MSLFDILAQESVSWRPGFSVPISVVCRVPYLPTLKYMLPRQRMALLFSSLLACTNHFYTYYLYCCIYDTYWLLPSDICWVLLYDSRTWVLNRPSSTTIPPNSPSQALPNRPSTQKPRRMQASLYQPRHPNQTDPWSMPKSTIGIQIPTMSRKSFPGQLSGEECFLLFGVIGFLQIPGLQAEKLNHWCDIGSSFLVFWHLFGFSAVMNVPELGLLACTCRQLTVALSDSLLVPMATWTGNQWVRIPSRESNGHESLS